MVKPFTTNGRIAMDNIVDKLNQTDFESFVFFNELVRDVADYLDENVEMHYDINDLMEFDNNRFELLYSQTFTALDTCEGAKSVVERFTEMSEECDDPSDAVHELRRRLSAWYEYLVRCG